MNALSLRFVVAGLLALAAGAAVRADSRPELLHYRFDTTSASVPNLASSPPLGAETAMVMGALTADGAELNFGGTGYSLVGSGNSSSTDYLNTGWATNLTGTSWTISFVTSNIGPSGTLFYIFGDMSAGSFRCFTNGVAGATNWILRGNSITDTYVNGGATVATHRTTFVYDMAQSHIRGYIDGVLVTTVVQFPLAIAGTGPFKVVGYGTNVGAPAGGLLDDFRVYNRALTDAEVAAIDTRPLVAVTGNGAPIADGDGTPDAADGTDFGGVLEPGLGTVVHTFTIRNNGNLDLTLDPIMIGGAHAEDFAVTALPTSPVAPMGTTTFDVAFDPIVVGLRTAQVTFGNNDDVANPFDFAIQGTGLPDGVFTDGFEGPALRR